jgi:hypothetical protein
LGSTVEDRASCLGVSNEQHSVSDGVKYFVKNIHVSIVFGLVDMVDKLYSKYDTKGKS